MNARLNYFTSPIAGKTLKHLMPAGKALKNTSLPLATQELVGQPDQRLRRLPGHAHQGGSRRR